MKSVSCCMHRQWCLESRQVWSCSWRSCCLLYLRSTSSPDGPAAPRLNDTSPLRGKHALDTLLHYPSILRGKHTRDTLLHYPSILSCTLQLRSWGQYDLKIYILFSKDTISSSKVSVISFLFSFMFIRESWKNCISKKILINITFQLWK